MPDSNVSASPLLAVRGLAFSRNETPVFGPLDFAVDSNEALLVQGGNGAGKTTLLRVLAGLLRRRRRPHVRHRRPQPPPRP
jgi:heme exporter protein A